MSGFFEDAGDAAERGAALGSVLGLVVATIPRAGRPAKDVWLEIVGIAAYWGLLGGLAGVVYEGAARVS